MTFVAREKHSMTTQPDPLANATLAEMETFAAGLLPTNALDYYASGARDELTFNGNLAAWARWWFVPRMLVDVSRVSLATTILGHPIALRHDNDGPAALLHPRRFDPKLTTSRTVSVRLSLDNNGPHSGSCQAFGSSTLTDCSTTT